MAACEALELVAGDHTEVGAGGLGGGGAGV